MMRGRLCFEDGFVGCWPPFTSARDCRGRIALDSKGDEGQKYGTNDLPLTFAPMFTGGLRGEMACIQLESAEQYWGVAFDFAAFRYRATNRASSLNTQPRPRVISTRMLRPLKGPSKLR
jgi:hypothetical protein